MKAYHQGQLDFFCAVYAFINSMRLMFGIQLTQARGMLAVALQEISAQPLLWDALLHNRTDHHWVAAYMLGRFCGPGGLPVRAARLTEAPLGGIYGAGEREILQWLDLKAPRPLSLQSLNEGHLYRPGVEFGPDLNPPPPGLKAPARAWNMGQLWPLLQRWLPSRKFMDIFGQPRKQQRVMMLRFHRFAPFQPQPVVSHWSTGHGFNKETLQLYDCTANREATHALPLAETALYPEDVGKQRYLALETQSLWFLEKV